MEQGKLLILIILLGFLSCKNETTVENQLPNVVIIFTDDQGYQDLGCFGSPDIETPNIDKMADEGVVLTDFYSAQAVCSASRAGLMTGCYPNRIGMHQAFMPHAKKGLHPDETTIAEMLKAQGYATAIYGKWHLGDNEKFMPLNNGFDEFYGIPYSGDMWPYHPQQGTVFNFGPLPLYENENIIDTLEEQSFITTEITKRSVQFIEKNKDKPFFLYVAHPQPHVPLFVSEKFKGKSKRGLYGDVIMELDWSVGEILGALKKHHLDENTLVIFTSDNGPWLAYGEHAGSALPLREGKGTAWEGGQRVPCVIQFPGKLKAAKIDVPVMNIDILPTIAALTNSKLPEKEIDGRNVWDIFAGKSNESVHEAYFYYYKVNELHGIRYKNWKMYFPHQYISLNGREGGKGGLPAKLDVNTLEEIELYDLSTDISETKNVAADHPEIVQKISAIADSMRIKLGDRLTGMEGKDTREPGFIEDVDN